MNAPMVALLALLSLFALNHLTEATASAGCSAEQSKRRHSCGGLVEEPPHSGSGSHEVSSPSPPVKPTTVPAPPPGQCVCTPAPGTKGPGGSGEGSGEGDFHSHCILVEAFYNMSLSLTVQQQVIWEAWIQEIENTILANVSLTDDEKVVLISISLKAFFSVNIEIYNELSFVMIADWGFVIDFLYVSIDIQLEITQSIVTLDGNGNCVLIEALLNATANGSPSEQAACNSLVIEIQAILEDSSYTYQQQLAVVFQIFQAFFVQNPSMESFFLSINIEGYGSVESFLSVCHVYEQITTLSVVIGGSSESDCVLLAALQEASTNSSFTAPQQAQILQLKQKLKVYFQSTTSLTLRMQYVSATCYQMFLLEPWMISIIEQISCGEWGAIYDIIFCSGICTNYGCGNPDNGPGPQGSTPGRSTVGVTKTTPGVKPHDCATIGSLIVVDSSNQTVLTNVLLQAYSTWTSSQKLGFNSCFNKVRNAIWNNVAFPTQTSKLSECKTDFYQYNNNSVTAQQLVFNLTISVWQGTIAQFVACCP